MPALLKGSSQAGVTERASAKLQGIICLFTGVSP